VELNFGTRTSTLARWQTGHIAKALLQRWPQLRVTIHPYNTSGDAQVDAPLPALGGKGAFTAELEAALRDGRIDVAVHSLKDLPVEHAPGLTVGAIVGRADVRDVVVARDGQTLASLPSGAVIGTSSLRRGAQVRARRPDVQTTSIRGNVETRIRKVLDGAYDATILAAAGVERLGLTQYVTEYLSFDVMLPAPGQGALAVQCRADDERTLELLRAIDNAAVRSAVTAERAFLHALDAGCSAPVAAFAELSDTGTIALRTIALRGMVAAVDGSSAIEVRGTGADAEALGAGLARDARDRGAEALLEHARSVVSHGGDV
jgi:hydroxymethylbilane synthase